jgi:hypothetical protein
VAYPRKPRDVTVDAEDEVGEAASGGVGRRDTLARVAAAPGEAGRPVVADAR